MKATEKPQAACAGEWELFDSTDPEDYLEAAAICADCPIVEACREIATGLLGSDDSDHGRIYGTWAGELYRDRKRTGRRKAA